MPRRTAPRCRRRGARGTLETTVECCLVWGHCFDVDEWQLRGVTDYAAHWAQWSDEITRRWREAVPGSRPMAAYILAEIPPPTWQHDDPIFRHPLRPIDGCAILVPDRTWHTREQELEHLDELGLIDDDEYEAALARLARGYIGDDGYRWISNGNGEHLDVSPARLSLTQRADRVN